MFMNQVEQHLTIWQHSLEKISLKNLVSNAWLADRRLRIYISFFVTQLHINVLKDLFYCKRKYVTICITPLTSFVSSYINFFPKFTLFHFQKKKLSNNRVKITLIFEIFGPILSFPLSVCGSYPVELTSLHPISYLMTLFYPISY